MGVGCISVYALREQRGQPHQVLCPLRWPSASLPLVLSVLLTYLALHYSQGFFETLAAKGAAAAAAAGGAPAAAAAGAGAAAAAVAGMELDASELEGAGWGDELGLGGGGDAGAGEGLGLEPGGWVEGRS